MWGQNCEKKSEKKTWEKNVWKKRFRNKFVRTKIRNKFEKENFVGKKIERKKNETICFRFLKILYTISQKCYCSTFLLVEKNEKKIVRKWIEEKIEQKKMWGNRHTVGLVRTKHCEEKFEKKNVWKNWENSFQ